MAFSTPMDIPLPNIYLHRHGKDTPHTHLTHIRFSYTCINSPTTTQQLKKATNSPPLSPTQNHISTQKHKKREKEKVKKRGGKRARLQKTGNTTTTTTRHNKTQKKVIRDKRKITSYNRKANTDWPRKPHSIHPP